MIRNLKRLGASPIELIDVYQKQVRSILELAVPVWTAGLTMDDIRELERVQKTALAIILGRKYDGYQDALFELQIESLKDRRQDLCIKFAKKASTHQEVTNSNTGLLKMNFPIFKLEVKKLYTKMCLLEH